MAASKLSEHWQVGKSLIECNLHMLEHNFSDVIFKLDYKQAQEKQKPVYVKALRLLLAARSPVFFAMFFGEHAKQETKNPVIDIHDIEHDAFKQMIRFIYSDEIQLTADNVLSVLYASKKYIVTTLTKRCTQFLEENLSAETAAPLLEQSMLYDEDDLKDKVLRKIEDEATEVLASEDFTKLSVDSLKEVLQLNLKVDKELEVFNASVRWAKNKCHELNKSCDGENVREVLGENLFLIRFPTMSVDEFNETVLPLEVLSSQEGFQVFRYMTSKSIMPEHLPFPTEPRVDAPPQAPLARSLLLPASLVQLYGGSHTNGPQTKQTTLNCTISKPMKLNAIFVHGPHPSLQVNQTLSVSVTQSGRHLLSYYGQHPVTPAAGDVPTHYAVRANDVQVEAGALQVNIQLVLQNMAYVDPRFSYLPMTRPTYDPFRLELEACVTSNPFAFDSLCGLCQLADDYVAISFPADQGNLLLGIEYEPIV